VTEHQHSPEPLSVDTLPEPWGTVALEGTRQPSGAVVTLEAATVLKSAQGAAAVKLKAQAEWLMAVASADPAAPVPRVIDCFEAASADREPLFAYRMPRYRPVRPDHRLAAAVVDALETVWGLAGPAKPAMASRRYARRLAGLVAPLCPRTADRLETAFRTLAVSDDDARAVTVHGDPTFENVATDERGRVVLLDPNPQSDPAIPLPELDLAKVALSLSGWEAFVCGDQDHVAPPTDIDRQLARLAPGRDRRLVHWLAAGHLVRTIPYGAKRNDSRAILPSLRLWLDRCG
jgi:hypothetical protein